MDGLIDPLCYELYIWQFCIVNDELAKTVNNVRGVWKVLIKN